MHIDGQMWEEVPGLFSNFCTTIKWSHSSGEQANQWTRSGRNQHWYASDCFTQGETLAYLAELTERMHVTIELGLQTTYEKRLPNWSIGPIAWRWNGQADSQTGAQGRDRLPFDQWSPLGEHEMMMKYSPLTIMVVASSYLLHLIHSNRTIMKGIQFISRRKYPRCLWPVGRSSNTLSSTGLQGTRQRVMLIGLCGALTMESLNAIETEMSPWKYPGCKLERRL